MKRLLVLAVVVAGACTPTPETRPTGTPEGAAASTDEATTTTASAYSCLSEARICVKPGDPCYGDGKQCAIGCSHDGNGKGGCLGREPPRP